MDQNGRWNPSLRGHSGNFSWGNFRVYSFVQLDAFWQFLARNGSHHHPVSADISKLNFLQGVWRLFTAARS